MFNIRWADGDTAHEWYVHLNLPTLLRMLEIEGITSRDIFYDKYDEVIKFEKVVLNYETNEDGYFQAWGFYEESYGNTLTKRYTIEIFTGTSLEDYIREHLLGCVTLADE